jgi:hypothetical protein
MLLCDCDCTKPPTDLTSRGSQQPAWKHTRGRHCTDTITANYAGLQRTMCDCRCTAPPTDQTDQARQPPAWKHTHRVLRLAKWGTCRQRPVTCLAALLPLLALLCVLHTNCLMCCPISCPLAAARHAASSAAARSFGFATAAALPRCLLAAHLAAGTSNGGTLCVALAGLQGTTAQQHGVKGPILVPSCQHVLSCGQCGSWP